MKEQRSFPDAGEIERGLMEHLNNGAGAKVQKNRYNKAVALGLIVIFIPAIAFTALMIAMPQEPSPLYLAGCGLAAILMTVAIVVVSVRLRKVQAEYFAGAAEEAEEYVSEIVEKFKSGQK